MIAGKYVAKSAKNGNERPSIPAPVKFELWTKSGGRCEFEGCNKPLWYDGLTFAKINGSNIAHIISWTPNGPRGDENLSEKLATDVNNLMLTCPIHNHLIDSKDHIEEYSVNRLREMKRKHEERIERVTSIMPNMQSTIIKYSANIGAQAIVIDEKEIASTILPDYYPDGNIRSIDLEHSTWYDNDPDFWQNEVKHLTNVFNQQILPDINNGNIKHISLFGFAPQPLLIYLGYLLNDKYRINSYQLNRNGNWLWTTEQNPIEFNYNKPQLKNGAEPVLKLQISGYYNDERVYNALPGRKIDIWELSVKNANSDIIKTKENLYDFKQSVRKLLEEIKLHYKEGTILKIFPVMPVSACIELGRLYLPKADMPLEIYNQESIDAGFKYAISIKGDL